MKKMLSIIVALSGCLALSAQIPDTSSVYKDRKDSLEATVFVGRHKDGISRGKDLRTELISSSGLQKMACCNLAESFENSASVTVGYSDATTGARQIKLLGLSGTYTQMLDENRPVLRGITAPFGLSYIPGPWLESIQIAKGSPSVINGLESMTGQINLEHKKPTEEIPLFIQTSMMSDSKADFNMTSAWELSPSLYTIFLGHVDHNFEAMDMNGDGFMDDPRMLQFNVSNRWLYYKPDIQVRWGVHAVRDHRKGGQEGYDKDDFRTPWGTDIRNNLVNGYLKVGKPLREDGSSSIAAIADYSFQKSDAWFGASSYLPVQHSGFMNLLYRNQVNEHHDFTVGLSGTYDFLDESVRAYALRSGKNHTVFGGAYGEYTFHAGDIFTAIAGFSADYYRNFEDSGEGGFKPAPRVTLKYSPFEWLVLRANGGRGLRYANPLSDNLGIFSTSKSLYMSCPQIPLEDSWTYGGNATFYLPLGVSDASLSFDYFRTDFKKEVTVDYESSARAIWLFIPEKGHSFSDNFQVDFSAEPFERFTVSMTGRYTHAGMPTRRGIMVEKPMISRYKGVLNLQYKTNLSRWIFDFTASYNGSARVYNFMRELVDDNGDLLYKDGRTPAYPLLFAQVTRRFKGFDIYVGGENLTNFTQKKVIIRENEPYGFDASCVWGPIMGRKINIGFRMTLWRKTKTE